MTTNNRVMRRILAEKSYANLSGQVTTTQNVFKSDVMSMNEKFNKLQQLISAENGDKDAIIKQLDDMISDMDSYSVGLTTLRNNIK